MIDQDRSKRAAFSTGPVLAGIAVVAMLIALFYAIENSRGKKAWAQCKQKMAAQGQNLDWSSFVPKDVPDSNNFAAVPFLKLLTLPPDEGDGPIAMRWPKDFNLAYIDFPMMRPAKKVTGQERQLTDLAAWRAAFVWLKSGDKTTLPEAETTDPSARTKAAADVLEFLQPYEPVLQELRQASARPEARFQVDYSSENPMAIKLSHLSRIGRLCNLLQVRVAAEVTLGQSEKAAQDLLVMLRLCEALNNEPRVLSYYMETISFRLTADTVWEGLAQHQWTDPQLRQIQAHLQKFDFLAGVETSLWAERAMGLEAIDCLRADPYGPGLATFNSKPFLAVALAIMPDGWLDLEACTYANNFPMPSSNSKTRRVDPALVQKQEQELGRLVSERNLVSAFFEHRLLSMQMLPKFSSLLIRAAETQTIADEAALACALERYRLANGKYPDQLNALTPKFIEKLPFDIIAGTPLLYHLDGRQFVLYSVGPNGRDDGGPAPAGAGQKTDDWFWRSQPGQ